MGLDVGLDLDEGGLDAGGVLVQGLDGEQREPGLELGGAAAWQARGGRPRPGRAASVARTSGPASWWRLQGVGVGLGDELDLFERAVGLADLEEGLARMRRNRGSDGPARASRSSYFLEMRRSSMSRFVASAGPTPGPGGMRRWLRSACRWPSSSRARTTRAGTSLGDPASSSSTSLRGSPVVGSGRAAFASLEAPSVLPTRAESLALSASRALRRAASASARRASSPVSRASFIMARGGRGSPGTRPDNEEGGVGGDGVALVGLQGAQRLGDAGPLVERGGPRPPRHAWAASAPRRMATRSFGSGDPQGGVVAGRIRGRGLVQDGQPGIGELAASGESLGPGQPEGRALGGGLGELAEDLINPAQLAVEQQPIGLEQCEGRVPQPEPASGG